ARPKDGLSTDDRANQQCGQVAQGGQVLEVVDQFDYLVRAVAAESAPGGAFVELGLQFGVGHRVGRAALAEVGEARERAAVVQLEVDDRGHLVVARRLGL